MLEYDCLFTALTYGLISYMYIYFILLPELHSTQSYYQYLADV